MMIPPLKEMQDKYFNFYECCLLTKGAKRSIVVDSQRNFFYFIPNDLFDLIMTYQGVRIKEILNSFEADDQKVVIEYFKFLYEKELIFLTNENLPFKPINMNLDFPHKLANAVIDFRDRLNFDLLSALELLQNLDTPDIQFRIYKNGHYFLSAIVEALKDLTFEHVDIMMNFENDKSYDEVCLLLKKHPNITSISIYNYSAKRRPNNPKMVHFAEQLTGAEMCGVVGTRYFNTNLYHYLESIKHNTCLNGKIAIDENGLVKQCPSMKQDYGVYSYDNLMKALKDKRYQKYATISKDQILVCKDCEFRNICSDCRAIITDEDNIYSKPLKCNYDPYTTQWH